MYLLVVSSAKGPCRSPTPRTLVELTLHRPFVKEGRLIVIHRELATESQKSPSNSNVIMCQDVTRILINGLESEERIVQAWRIDAQEMDKKLDKLDLNKFQKMSLYRKVFAKSVVNLRESAEDYLKLPKEPVEIFVDDLKARRKRSLSEKALVRKHTRNF